MTTTRDRQKFLRQRFNRLTFQYHLNPFTRWVGRSELAVLRDMIPPPPHPGETHPWISAAALDGLPPCCLNWDTASPDMTSPPAC